jgi:hypothetical protein
VAEGHEPLGDQGAAVDLLIHKLQVFSDIGNPHRAITQSTQARLEGKADGGEWIVDLVGHPVGQQADRGETLLLGEAYLIVKGADGHHQPAAIGPDEGRGMDLDADLRVVATQHAHHRAQGLRPFLQFCDRTGDKRHRAGLAEPAADAMAGSAADGIQGRWIRVA